MKSRFNTLVALAIGMVFSLIENTGLDAQTFSVLHNFSSSTGNGAINRATNSDGFYPFSLVLSGNTLFGGTYYGGGAGCGVIFRMNTDGSGFTVLHSFTNDTSNYPIFGTGEGARPIVGLISSNKIYGVAEYGGTGASGTIFSMNTDGTGFLNLHNFTAYSGGYQATNTDGARPFARLVLSGNTLYGVTADGGGQGQGALFVINTDGSCFTNLWSFTPDAYMPNSLILSQNTLYGTSVFGGAANYGSVFSIGTNGLNFTNLHEFDFTDGADIEYPDNIVISGDTLYGVTGQGGTNNCGVVFKVNIDGTDFINLHNLNPSEGEGASGIVLSGNVLYAATGGTSNNTGSLFSLNKDGSGFVNLYNFSSLNGNGPCCLILNNNTLYGVAGRGGTAGTGTIFSLTLPSPPQLSIARSGPNVVLTWPTNATVYTLQCCPDLTATNWVTVSPSPVVVGGQNTVTNAIASSQMFYRLIQ